MQHKLNIRSYRLKAYKQCAAKPHTNIVLRILLSFAIIGSFRSPHFLEGLVPKELLGFREITVLRRINTTSIFNSRGHFIRWFLRWNILINSRGPLMRWLIQWDTPTSLLINSWSHLIRQDRWFLRWNAIRKRRPVLVPTIMNQRLWNGDKARTWWPGNRIVWYRGGLDVCSAFGVWYRGLDVVGSTIWERMRYRGLDFCNTSWERMRYWRLDVCWGRERWRGAINWTWLDQICNKVDTNDLLHPIIIDINKPFTFSSALHVHASFSAVYLALNNALSCRILLSCSLQC